MPIKLSNADHKKLDAFLGQILDWHSAGAVTKDQAIAALAHVFTAAAIDNAGEVHSWLDKPEVLRTWKSDADADRT